MKIKTIILFTILIIGGVYVDNCQRKQTTTLAGQIRTNILRHEQRGLFSRPTTESTGRNRKPDGKGDSIRGVRFNGNSRYSNNTITFIVTAYTKNDKGMNGRGITSRGTRVKKHYTLANDQLPLGTKIYFPELKRTYVVEDRFSKDKHVPLHRLDMYELDRTKCIKFGKRKIKGVILSDEI